MLCYHFGLDTQPIYSDDVVKSKNRPREAAINDGISSHVSDEEAATEISRIQISITGMTCSSCVNKIESSLSCKRGKICCLKYTVI